jgi:ankyrin repeat protein
MPAITNTTKLTDEELYQLNVDLSVAAADANLDDVITLVERGAEVNRRHKYDKRTPLMLLAARSEGKPAPQCIEVAKYLLDHGADKYLRTDGFSAADYAKLWESYSLARFIDSYTPSSDR